MENYDNSASTTDSAACVTFVAWPEIKGLHNVLTSLEKSAKAEKLLGAPIMPLHIAFTKTLQYRPKVKLHGTLRSLLFSSSLLPSLLYQQKVRRVAAKIKPREIK
jgi:hypothetical protein